MSENGIPSLKKVCAYPTTYYILHKKYHTTRPTWGKVQTCVFIIQVFQVRWAFFYLLIISMASTPSPIFSKKTPTIANRSIKGLFKHNYGPAACGDRLITHMEAAT